MPAIVRIIYKIGYILHNLYTIRKGRVLIGLQTYLMAYGVRPLWLLAKKSSDVKQTPKKSVTINGLVTFAQK